MSKKAPTLFDFLNQIYSKSRKHKYDKKIAGSYILSLWLSMDKELLDKVNAINKYQFLLRDEIIYEYYQSVIPKGKRYIKFTKKRKEESSKKIIEKLKDENPDLSTRECEMIISSLKKERRKNEDKYQKF